MHQQPLSIKPLPLVDASWTLFLDRDGVINKEVVGDYVYTPASFVFEDGALEALRILSKYFPCIIVVSNQRGVGKGLMTEEALKDITSYMLQQVQKAGGRIDAVYYCTSAHPDDPDRKPNSGMAHKAKAAFPDISFEKSIMVGNMPSDMWFGRNIGAFTVYIPNRNDEIADENTVDAQFKDLLGFATALAASAKKHKFV